MATTAVTAVTVQRYRQSSKKVKEQILDQFCEITADCRGYARSRVPLVFGFPVRDDADRSPSRTYEHYRIGAESDSYLWSEFAFCLACPLLGIAVELSSIRYRTGLQEVKENVLFILRRFSRAGLELL
ncbi:MAG TPA: hypothetical protein VGC73_09220 [Pyrinomonadaceae bacterium]